MNGVGVEARGRSGGLALLWDKKVTISIQSYSLNHIDAIVFPDNSTAPCRFTGFYGEPDQAHRKRTWDLLRHLGMLSVLPWVCMGDVNEVLDDSERRGGIPMPGWRMRQFWEAIPEVGLANLGFRVFPFTWSDNRLAPLTIWRRLDRVFASADWSLQYQHASVVHLVSRGSDH